MEKLNMREHGTDGLLITFCGLDGCGKSTMIQKVLQYFSDKTKDIVLTKQPTNFVRQSEIFRTYMDQENHDAYDYRSLSLLAASDRVQHCNKTIMPALESGRIVLSDRYFYSCLANLRARGYYDDVWIYDVAKSIPKPDIAFFFDLPIDIAVERVRSREDEKDRYIDMELQKKLKAEYLEIAKMNQGVVISTLLSEEDSFNLVKNAIDECLLQKKDYGKRVRNVLKRITECETIENTDLLTDDLQMDSLAHVMLMIELETEFNITFSEADLNPYDFKTVNDVIQLIQKYKEENDV